MKHLGSYLRMSVLGWLLASTLVPAWAADTEPLPPPTNNLERMHLKNVRCTWTREIGDYIYKCLKDNFGMNAHWCHNEAMETLCPKQAEQADAAGGAPARP